MIAPSFATTKPSGSVKPAPMACGDWPGRIMFTDLLVKSPNKMLPAGSITRSSGLPKPLAITCTCGPPEVFLAVAVGAAGTAFVAGTRVGTLVAAGGTAVAVACGAAVCVGACVAVGRTFVEVAAGL